MDNREWFLHPRLGAFVTPFALDGPRQDWPQDGTRASWEAYIRRHKAVIDPHLPAYHRRWLLITGAWVALAFGVGAVLPADFRDGATVAVLLTAYFPLQIFWGTGAVRSKSREAANAGIGLKGARG